MSTEPRLSNEPAAFSHDPDTSRLFASHFDRVPFLFHHNLHRMAIFQRMALLKLAERCMERRQHKSHYETGTPVANGYFGNKPQSLTLLEALKQVEEGQNWIILKRIHEEPEYGEALEEFTSELTELTGVDLKRRYRDPIVSIFITSPGRITPYHLDGEANFLAQISGTKSAFLYNADDPKILTIEE
jgi:hypothetical protein